MTVQRSAEQQGELEHKGAKRRGDAFAAEPAMAPPLTPVLKGPAALRPAAVLQRQAVLGNAHTGRVFRSVAPDAAAPTEEKEGCQCADKEHCTCGK